MKRLLTTSLLFGGLLLRPACADRVTMRDGTVQDGIIVSKEANEIRLLLDADSKLPDAESKRRVVIIPRSKIADIKEMVGPEPASASAPALVAPEAAARPGSADGFFTSMAKLAVGINPDLADPESMDPSRQQLWQKILAAEAQKSDPDILNALTALANSCNQDPHRLNALAHRHVEKSYGQWLAPFRWESIKNNYRTGRFDLKDVTEIERTALIGILRQETDPSQTPLKSFYPKPRDPALHLTPGQLPPDPLSGITISNALDIKDHALYASAILLAQLRLEPDMPVVDRAFLSRQLNDVRATLARALRWEPLARREAAKQALHSGTIQPPP